MNNLTALMLVKLRFLIDSALDIFLLALPEGIPNEKVLNNFFDGELPEIWCCQEKTLII